MAKDTQSSRIIKYDENNNANGKQNKGSTAASDTPGLRRSARETPLKKSIDASPSSTRKSERLDKHTLTPPSVKRKSERLEKQKDPSPLRRSDRAKNPSPSTPKRTKKLSSSTPERAKKPSSSTPERAKKPSTSTPVRAKKPSSSTPERAKKLSSSMSSLSQKSGKPSDSLDMKWKKEIKEKSVEQLTFETGEVCKSGKQDVESGEVTIQRMDARAYRALFRKQEKKKQSKNVDMADPREERNMPDKGTRNDTINCTNELDGADEYSKKREELRTEHVGSASESAMGPIESESIFAEELLDKNNGAELCPSSSKHSFREDFNESENQNDIEICSKQMTDSSEREKVSFAVKEQLQTRELIGSALNSKRPDEGKNFGGDCELISLKRKRSADDSESDSSVIGRTYICTSPADVIPSSSFSYKQKGPVENCSTCFKRQRIDHDSTKQEGHCEKLSQQSCDAPSNMDRGEFEVNITTDLGGNSDSHLPQKGSSVSLQKDVDQNTCYVCERGGKLLCCEGRECNRSFHLSCLDPPLKDVPLGVWHCLICVKKKIDSGVHSVSQGIELIVDVREVEIPDGNRMKIQKQFLIKYKDLAHVHNRWVPEDDIPAEASSLVAKFIKTNQARWEQEGAVPHRLLEKRSLVSTTSSDKYHMGFDGDKLGCQYEWLVKWRGLDYEHATWELENAPFLNSPEVQQLVQDYENRHEKANKASSSEVDKIQERKRTAAVTASQLRSGGSPGIDSNHPNYVSKLCEFWHRGQNAVVIDNQERIGNIIAFILTLQPSTCQPFLIISTSSALSSWDDQFLRLAPSLNAVVYKGSKNIRNIIRRLEFIEEGGCVGFHFLITPPEVIIEDLDVLRSIRWEVIIVDECQRPIIASHFEQIKTLTTEMRLLVLSGQLKDRKDEYLNVISLLEFNSESSNNDASATTSTDNINKLKERLSRHIAYACNSKFVEYWVPAQISHVQLEQYCANLLSNSMSLCSSSKNDPVGVLRDILIFTRKCCNHPYTVDPSVQSVLTKGLQEVEYLDVGIKVSGKLQLLDEMLMEMKKRDLRVLILFQSICSGSGRDTIGDILDDFLRQRFGPSSYERVEGGLLHSKKQAALNKFNNKEHGRFVFLLEVRACQPSIKLSSVDSIIIFDSDWTPTNDLKALQRITLDSQFELTKIFRLYSSCTVEEKVLILAMQNKILDSNLLNISQSTSQMLLMWGASHLFDSLEKFHDSDIPAFSAVNFLEQSLLKDVLHDMFSILSQNVASIDTHNSRVILKVQQIEGRYFTDRRLPGELKIPSMDETAPHLFWTKLLEGKNPQWRYSSVSSQRNRKRVQHTDGLSNKSSGHEKDEVAKKSKKVRTSNVNQTSSRAGSEGRASDGDKEGGSGAPENVPQYSPIPTTCKNDLLDENHAFGMSHAAKIPEDKTIESEKRRKLHDLQKSLHILLKPQILKLCQVLELPENVRPMVEKFLEYVMVNHHVNREPATILQAFQIAVCWTAASLLKYKINHKESLALAKQHLNFICKKEEADFIYSMLRCLKKMFLYRSGKYKIAEQAVTSLPNISSITNLLNAQASQLKKASDLQKGKVEAEEGSLYNESFDNQVLLLPELALKDISKSIKEIKKKSKKQLEKLMQKQQEEKDELKKSNELEKLEIEKKQRMESAVIRSCLHSNPSMRTDKLKILETEFAKKFEGHQNRMATSLKDLEAVHLVARNKLLEREAHWVKELKSWAQAELLNKQTLNGTRTNKVDDPENVAPVVNHLSRNERPGKVVCNLPGYGEGGFGIPEKSTLPVPCNGNNNQLDNMGTEGASVTGVDELGDEVEKKQRTSKEQISNGVSLSVSNDVIQQELPQIVLSRGGTEEVVTLNSLPSEELNVDGAITDMAGGEVTLGAPNIVGSGDCLNNVVPLNTEEFPRVATDQDIPLRGGPENLLGTDSSTNEEQILLRPALCIPVGEISPRTHDGATCEVEGDNGSGRSEGRDLIVTNNYSGVNQQDATAFTDNQVSHFEQQPNQPLQDEFVPQSTPMPASEMQNTSLTVELPVCQLHQEEPSIEPLVRNGCIRPDPPSADGVEHHPSRVDTSYQHVQATRQLVENPAVERSSQAVLQPVTNISTRESLAPSPDARATSITSEIGNSHMQTGQPALSRNPLLLYSDPLQNELERIRKEIDQTMKMYEEKKLQLKSECEKEIVDVIAQIRRKYEMKDKELDAEFLPRKKDLDANHNKVLMNKILAEAFRSKCMDLKASGTSGMQRDIHAGFAHQLLQLSQQQIPQRPSLPIRPSSLVAPASTPLATLQRMIPPRVSRQTSPPIQNPRSTTPSLHTIHHAPALLSNNSIRPLHIGSISSSTPNLQAAGAIRAPAPHLQPFRPSTSMSATSVSSFPHGMPSQLGLGNPPASSPTFSHLPRLSQMSVLDNRESYEPDSSGGLPIPNTSLSALELLRNVDSRAGINFPSTVLSVPDLGSNLDSASLCVGTASGERDNTVHGGANMDVVCLSDDD